MTSTPRIDLAPQAGPQTQFLGCFADIVIYGGAAGGGKSYGLLLDPLRHIRNKEFGCTIFRRTAVQVTIEGGLWDESMKLYPMLGGRPREHKLEWRFPSGMSVGFGHLEYDKDVLSYQGAQIPLIDFDELTHFTQNQFFYMLSRNRSTSGVKPRIRATTNPDPDSWVRKFIDWWIGADGYAVKERAGRIRWFIRQEDKIVWGDTREELLSQFGNGPEIVPKSVAFIPARLQDNQILMQKDPAYLGNLLAMNRVDRLRLLGGNWNVRASAGMMFQRDWFEIIDAIPSGWISCVRYWDRAATKVNETNRDPDWTRGLKLYKYPDGSFVVADIRSVRDTPGKVEELVKTTASHDGWGVTIWGEQDPGSAGVADAARFTSMLAGYDVRIQRPTKDKVTRAKPVSAQSEARNIKVIRALWNDDFFSETENFDENGTGHDDIVDVFSGAFNVMCGELSTADVM